MGVGPTPAFMLGGVGPQDVFDSHKVLVAQGLGGLDIVPDCRRVGSNLRLRENDSQLHGLPSWNRCMGLAEVAAPVAGPAWT